MSRIAAVAVRVLTAGLVAAVALSGCARQAEGERQREGGRPQPTRLAGDPTVHGRWTSCAVAANSRSATPNHPEGNDALRMPLLGEGFDPVAAVLCEYRPKNRPGGGVDLMDTESRANDVAALLAALRLPDESRMEEMCTMDMPIVPWFVLLDREGRWIRPGVPRDGCGKPRIEVRRALTDLSQKEISASPVQQIKSDGAAKAGCEQSWADMVWVETTNGRRDWATSFGQLFPTGTVVRRCVYQVPPDQRRTSKPAGDFTFGGPLPAARWVAIDKAIGAAVPAKPCTLPASRFALLHAETGGSTIYVELDACRRVMVETISGPPALRQADSALLALLTAK